MNRSNFEELFDEDTSNIDRIHYWYERLVEYELDENESRDALEVVIRALKWVMQFEHTRAEQLKELAEKDASDLAEKEENWEQERENLKKELEDVRGKLLSTIGNDQLSETFRAQIDSLREENAYLKVQNRERDRELADQRDKEEEFSSKIEQLEKERNALTSQQNHLDDTIRELNRRLSSKTEQSAKNESDARKLRQRSEQAAKLSSQLQEVIHQNDQLTAEVERLSEALSSASTYIEDTTNKYSLMHEQLLNSEAIIERLSNENNRLVKQMEEGKETLEKLESNELESERRFETIMKKKDSQLEKFRESIQLLQLDLEEAYARSRLDRTEEREHELERLRNELVSATNLVRELFGKSDSSEDHHQNAQLRLKEVESLNERLREESKQREELVKNIEVKDTENMKINAEMKHIREARFGSAESEITRLEVQLKFRDEQIQKMSAKCSLLQAELASLTEMDPQNKCTAFKYDSVIDASVKPHENELQNCGEHSDDRKIYKETTEKGIETEAVSWLNPNASNKQQHEVTANDLSAKALNSWEASAVLISSLNCEIMLLMQEVDERVKQHEQISKLLLDGVPEVNKIKANYIILQKEAAALTDKRNNKDHIQENVMIEEYEIQLKEYKRICESVRLNGDELQRRLEETSRRLIVERIQSARSFRKIQVLERSRNEAREQCAKLRRRLNENISLHSRQMKLANYEADLMAIEMARLQDILLHSVPEVEYQKLTKKYKMALHQEFFFTSNADETEQNEHFGIQLLRKCDNHSIDAEVAARNEYFKNMIAALSHQIDYWQMENEKVRSENDELKAFLEDIESESNVKAMIVAIERRFVSFIAERSEREPEELLASSQARQFQNELAKKRREWAAERKKLIEIIQFMQSNVQKIRRNAMEMMTVEQVMELKDRIKTVHENQLKSEQELEEASKRKQEASLQLMKAEALQRSFDALKEDNYDLIKLQKTIQVTHLNLLNVTSQMDMLKSQVEKKDTQIASQKEEISELKKQICDWMSENLRMENLLTEELDDKRSGMMTIEMEEHGTGGRWLDSRYVSEDSEESVVLGADSLASFTNNDIRTKTIVFDNSNEYEKKIRYIRETAEVCIQNYKDQLDYKEEAIKKYKALLENLQNDRDATERHTENRTDELVKQRRWKKSEELLNGKELEEKKREIVKLKTEIKDLEDANYRLGEQVQEQQKIGGCKRVERHEAFVQTSFDERLNNENSMQNEDHLFGISQVDGRDKEACAELHDSSSLPKDILQSNDEYDRETRNERCIMISPSNPEKVDSEDRIRMVQQFNESIRQEQSKCVSLSNEIRRLKQRLNVANAENQELQKACENIRLEALTQIGQKYTKIDQESVDLESTHLRKEIQKLKSEINLQRRTIKSQKETIEMFQSEQKKGELKTTKDELTRWRERKLRENNANVLRRRLIETEERLNELEVKLLRREKRITQMERDEKIRMADQERICLMNEELKRQHESISGERDQLNIKLITTQQTLEALHRQIDIFKKENLSLNEKLEKMEKLSFKQQNAEILVNDEKVKYEENIAAAILAETNNRNDERRSLQKKLRLTELRYEEAMERLNSLEKEYQNLRIDYESLVEREKSHRKEKHEGAAVAVLRDKLMAKEKLINELVGSILT
ncbi:unnamed protein product [Anisakis simplex]|uniref:Centrosomal protein n=1 Tax=Anisakis simplex TaxID=6269 RepID=A0A158PN05_ANISI|nr:unnamed protein product [Anisakis simplex]